MQTSYQSKCIPKINKKISRMSVGNFVFEYVKMKNK